MSSNNSDSASNPKEYDIHEHHFVDDEPPKEFRHPDESDPDKLGESGDYPGGTSSDDEATSKYNTTRVGEGDEEEDEEEEDEDEEEEEEVEEDEKKEDEKKQEEEVKVNEEEVKEEEVKRSKRKRG
ncbi:hypothetical protein LIER_21793 [Lithospermum erythrorhizon]|uniref:Uncharacterized protein n=1 Tax=Lithospermum erythrorhizon TaxID=34254 RepID=A0AAV3QRN3_LITER